MTYSVENILAEKFETCLDRGVYNTRIRDFLDVYMLMEYDISLIDYDVLTEMIIFVSKERNTINNLYKYDEKIKELKNSLILKKNYENYLKKNYKNKKIQNIDINNVFEAFDCIYYEVKKVLYK